MTQYSLFPSFVQVTYHSPRMPHVMTVPTRQWNPGADQGEFTNWEDTTVDADTMINDMVDTLVGNYGDNIAFDFYTIFNYPSEDSFPEAVAFGALTQVGTADPDVLTWLAVQATLTFACASNHNLKIVELDAAIAANQPRLGAIAALATYPTLIAEIISSDNAWASRAGTQPIFLKQAAYTFNEKLRRAYRLN